MLSTLCRREPLLLKESLMYESYILTKYMLSKLLRKLLLCVFFVFDDFIHVFLVDVQVYLSVPLLEEEVEGDDQV